MSLRSPKSSTPPTFEELEELHQLQWARSLYHQKHHGRTTTAEQQLYPSIHDYTFRSSTVVYPENRNMHGKLFGGFVMEEAAKLAQYTATFFAQGEPVMSFGLDEAVFHQPISIGDLVTFTARCVHSTPHTCRVLVIVEVRNAKEPHVVPVRSNRLLFIFGAKKELRPDILPQTYGEMLMHIDSKRRYAVEGPTKDEVLAMLDGK